MADMDCLVSRRPVVSSADSICSACWCASEICYVVRETVDRVRDSFAQNVGWFLKYCGVLIFFGCFLMVTFLYALVFLFSRLVSLLLLLL